LAARTSAKYLLRLLRPALWEDIRQRKSLGALVLMACISGVMGLVWPLATRTAIDLLVEASWSRFLIYCAVLTTALASQAVVGYYSSMISSVLVQGFVRSLRDRCFASHLAFAAFGRSETGESLVTMINDCGRVGSLSVGIVSSVSVTLLALIGTVAAMAVMSPVLLMLCVVPTVVLAWAYQSMEPQLIQRSQREREAAGRLSSIAKDHLDKARVLRGLRGEVHSLEAIRVKLDECRDSSIGLAMTHARLQLIASSISIVGQLLVLAYGGVLFLSDSITLGTVFAFGALFSRLFGPVGSLWGIRGSLNSAAPSIERVYRSLFGDQAPELPRILDNLGGLVQAVNAELTPGRCVGLTGPVGAGKSTICLALMIESWQASAGEGPQQAVLYLPQNAQLPRCTVRAILTMGRGSAIPDSHLMEALEIVRLAPRIRAYPQGLDIELGPSGVDLSAGETQQLLLARAALDSYDLVILDESTSSLDTQTALGILAHLKGCIRSTGGRVLVVTHRREEIAVLDGQLILEGGALRPGLVGDAPAASTLQAAAISPFGGAH
jgi:ABC-type multidrug transport system fused ATPase/permease subunit